jgi:hypothetical protein
VRWKGKKEVEGKEGEEGGDGGGGRRRRRRWRRSWWKGKKVRVRAMPTAAE